MSYTNPQDVAHAAMKLGIAIDAFSAIIDSDEVVDALTTREKDIIIEALEMLDDVQEGMESFVENQRPVVRVQVPVNDPHVMEALANIDELFERLDERAACDQPEQQAAPCPGTCYECTKEEADEFWAGIDAAHDAGLMVDTTRGIITPPVDAGAHEGYDFFVIS